MVRLEVAAAQALLELMRQFYAEALYRRKGFEDHERRLMTKRIGGR